MIEIVGDIREELKRYSWDAICCTINTTVGKNGLVMGAGTALVFKRQWNYLPKTWGLQISEWGDNKTYVLVTPHTVHDNGHIQYAIGFPTKTDWRKPSEVTLIERSAKQLRILIEAMQWKNVLLPRPGCQNGLLDWEDVKKIIQPILKNKVTIINK